MISCLKQKYALEDSWLVKIGLSDGQVKYCLKEDLLLILSIFFLKIRIALFAVYSQKRRDPELCSIKNSIKNFLALLPNFYFWNGD